VASVLFLNLATGGSKSGTGIVILIPLIWTALYHRRWESFVVVAAIVGAEIVTALTPDQLSDAAILRRVVLWSALGVMISLATHELRERLLRTLTESEDSRHRTESLQRAAEELTTLVDSAEILSTATRLAALLVSPPGTPGRRSQYLRVVDGMVTIDALYDEIEHLPIAPFPLAEHPNLEEVMRTGTAVNRPLNYGQLGPAVQGVVSGLGVTNGVYVPLRCDGQIDGVLAVSVRGKAVSDALFECCRAIGHLTELALQNARSHDRLAKMATTDALTGVVNRRAFDQAIAHRPAGLGFCLLLLDLDNLKKVNDSAGHGAGDDVLEQVARVLEESVRVGDLVARLGGDEFAVMLMNADEHQGAQTATRILAALSATSCGVSIGVAAGGPTSDAEDVVLAADAAMYRATQDGGRRYAVSHPPDAEASHLEQERAGEQRLTTGDRA
jgi:diguanylate cyclase (GGDEF)-like protein